MFGGGMGAPAPNIIPTPIPTKSDAEVQADASAERLRIAAAGGRQSTFLTSIQDNAAVPDRKPTLLGAA